MSAQPTKATVACPLLALALLLASTGLQAQTPEPTREAAAQAPQTGSGQALFESRCALCHRGSGPGVFMLERRLGQQQSVLEERSGLAADYVRAVVRNGIGSMPRFSRGELTDDELQQVIGYLER
jgi:mono/diheme cytochrome c family protein